MIVDAKVKEAYGARTIALPKKQAVVQNQLDREIVDTVSLSGSPEHSKKAGGIKPSGQMDKVDLTKGFSVDDVNRLLVSEVGKKVKAMFDEAGIDPVAVADTDWSPAATAERIFRGTTAMFEIWRAQHKDMSEEKLIDSFEQVLRASVDRGAAEAIGLIEARKFEEEDSIVGTARDTISLVHQKFDEYFASKREELTGQQPETGAVERDETERDSITP